MKPFTKVRSVITHLDKINVDTDQIIPKQFLKLVTKTGFGDYLFYNWRYDENENPRKDFVLNDEKARDSEILLAGQNFGCGSSREHAVWALKDYGFSVIIAPSFADIFYNNCFKNGILPIKVDSDTADKLKDAGEVEVDLKEQTIKTKHDVIHFDIEPYRKKILLEGLDDIALTLQYEDKITQYEKDSKTPSVL